MEIEERVLLAGDVGRKHAPVVVENIVMSRSWSSLEKKIVMSFRGGGMMVEGMYLDSVVTAQEPIKLRKMADCTVRDSS